MNFVHGSALSAAIQNIVAGQHADMAVAFWGHDACKRLSISPAASGSRVACDARSGGCNPSALADLLKRNVAIVDVPRLHAKVYIGNKGVVISSANASANGLGEEGEEVSVGLEVGYLTERPEDIEVARQWFEAIYQQGNPVTKDDLKELRKLWLERRKQRPRRDRRSFLQVLLEDPGSLSDRSLKVVIYTFEPPTTAQVKMYKTRFNPNFKHKPGDEYPFFWDAREWGSKEGDLILCFLAEADGKILCDGVWRVQAVIAGGEIIPAAEVQTPLGLPLPRSDQKKLAKLVKTLVDSHDLNTNGQLISIGDFAQSLGKSKLVIPSGPSRSPMA